MRYFLLSIILAVLPVFGEDNPFSGEWEGELLVGEYELGFQVRFYDDDGRFRGIMDIPEQQAFDMQLINIEQEGDYIHFELDSPLGVSIYEGKRLGNLIEGSFSQGKFFGDWTLLPKQEQKDQLDLPYYTEEVAIKGEAGLLAGTFSRPDKNGRHPAVVMATGSGLQNRDEDVFGFKVFKVIADYLTRNGYAILRCDDRGFAKSKGDPKTATTLDFAKDIQIQYEYLKTREDVDTMQIGIIGHSEGAVIAPMVATWENGVRFIVLLAPPGVKGSEVVMAQIEAGIANADLSEEQKSAIIETQKKAEQAVVTGEISEEIEDLLRDQIRQQVARLTEEQRSRIEDMESFVDQQYKIKIESMMMPWTRFYFQHDPAPVLAEVKCPVLAVFGGRDTQVLLELNRPAVEKALEGNKDHKILVFPEANHLFQKSEIGSIEEYRKLPKEFTEGFLKKVFNWMESETDFPK